MREFTVENNGANVNLVYSLKKTDVVDTVALGMMQNNRIDGLIPMLYTQVDADKLLKYNITSKITMQQLFERSVTKNRLVKCFLNIIQALDNAEEYMIDINTLLIETKNIYVNVSSLDTELLCLPIRDESKSVNLEMFFKNIIFSVQFDQSENCDYVAKIISYLNSGSFSLNDFKDVLFELLGQKVEKKEEVVEDNNFEQSESVKTIVDASKFEMRADKVVISQKEEIPTIVKPASNPVEKPPIPSKAINDSKKDKREKKEKKSLFGKKKEKAPKIVQPSMDMAIPGMPSEIPQSNINSKSVSNMQIPGVSEQPVSSNTMPSIPQTTFTQSSANFGETTVLNVPSSGIGETTVLGVSSGNAQTYEPKPYLIRKKNNERILISKSVFKIGKENSYVDYFIGDNTAISRSHATILTKGNNYYLMDTNSKNHTFVNGTMISPNIEVPVKPGTIIKLADEEFEFVMQ
ncbi:MAG: FHA domain-containing protein [Lachnospiraceae bacterium]|nr:FHA domain-containing protein [Lachnospiraceae bacterium]